MFDDSKEFLSGVHNIKSEHKEKMLELLNQQLLP